MYGATGEALELIVGVKKGFDGVGGESEARLPTGTRLIDIGRPDIPNPWAVRSESFSTVEDTNGLCAAKSMEPCDGIRW